MDRTRYQAIHSRPAGYLSTGSIECGRLGPRANARCIEFRRGRALCRSLSKEVICPVSRGCAAGMMLTARDEIRASAERASATKQPHRRADGRRGGRSRAVKTDAQPCHGSLFRPGITSGKYLLFTPESSDGHGESTAPCEGENTSCALSLSPSLGVARLVAAGV